MTALAKARQDYETHIANAKKFLAESDAGEDTLEKIRNTNKLAEEAGKKVEELVKMEKMVEATKKEEIKKEEDKEQKKANVVVAPGAPVGMKPEAIGSAIVKSDLWKDWKEHGRTGTVRNLKVAPALTQAELKATFGTHEYGATIEGYNPESIRVPGLQVDYAFQTPMVIDVVPTGTTNSPQVKYMEETTLTHRAAERVEEGLYAQSDYAFTEKMSPVELLGHFVPVTDEMVRNEAWVEAYLNNRLTSGLRRRVSSQLLNGNGTSPNLRGILNVTGITTHAATANSNILDLILDRIVQINKDVFSAPNTMIINLDDWKKIRNKKTSDGIYIFGNPDQQMVSNLWNVRPVPTTEMTAANTLLIGDFNECMQLYQWGIEVETGFSGDDFLRGKKSVRAGMATAFVVFRPKAFSTLTATNNAS